MGISKVESKNPVAEKKMKCEETTKVDGPSEVMSGEERKVKEEKKKGIERMWVPLGALGIMKIKKIGPIVAKESRTKPAMPAWKDKRKNASTPLGS